MNFFEQQDEARKRTKWLVVLFVLAVLFTVALVDVAALIASRATRSARRARSYYDVDGPVLQVDDGQRQRDMRVVIAATCITLLIIGGASAYKTLSLAGGGSSVAELLGGRPINTANPEEATLQNVVEEMSIASGVPVPRVYVLDHEEGINAFAAGHTMNDAAIGVTRGAITGLSRDQLQGVIGHEFSHILNGDSKINIRLIGLLNGILVVSLIGLGIIRSVQYAPVSRRRDDNGAGIILAAMVFGCALYAVGSIGVLFSRLIQAAVSRQREFLADASAVQFTRNPAGLAGALKKLGEFSSGSRVRNPHALETAHLFFASSAGMFFSSLLATHPPLEERIKRLDPTFDGHFDYKGDSHLMEQYDGTRATLMPEDHRNTLSAMGFIDRAGRIGPVQLRFAAGLIGAIPAPLADAARDPFNARALIFAMLVNADPAARQKQLSLIQQSAEPATYQAVVGLLSAVEGMNEGMRLPLLDLSLPALRAMSPQQAGSFLAIVRQMIEADGKVTLFEYTLNRLLIRRLAPGQPAAAEPVQFIAIASVKSEAAIVLSALAMASSADTVRAFDLGSRQLDADGQLEFVHSPGLAAIDSALNKLARTSAPIKRRLMAAAACAVAADVEVNVAEAELLRSIGAALDVPIPPLVTNVSITSPDAA